MPPSTSRQRTGPLPRSAGSGTGGYCPSPCCGTPFVVEDRIGGQYPPQVALVEDQQVGQALPTDAAHPPFGEAVRTGAARRCIGSLGRAGGWWRAPSRPAGARPGYGLAGPPRRRSGARYSRQAGPDACAPPGKSARRWSVGARSRRQRSRRRGPAAGVAAEGAPRDAATERCGAGGRPALEHVADRRATHGVPEFGQLPLDTFIAPLGMLAGTPQDQRLEVRAEGRPTEHPAAKTRRSAYERLMAEPVAA
jgi:hypothetical protein